MKKICVLLSIMIFGSMGLAFADDPYGKDPYAARSANTDSSHSPGHEGEKIVVGNTGPVDAQTTIEGGFIQPSEGARIDTYAAGAEVYYERPCGKCSKEGESTPTMHVGNSGPVRAETRITGGVEQRSNNTINTTGIGASLTIRDAPKPLKE